jgi:hypothetical protein
VSDGRIERRPASGHFGSWTICTEIFAPLRVEARDGASRLLGSVDWSRVPAGGRFSVDDLPQYIDTSPRIHRLTAGPQ